MSDLTFNERQNIEKIFNRDGYVFGFSDRLFTDFFAGYGVNIDDEKYRITGQSKMRRLRIFLQLESNELVAKVLSGMLEFAMSQDLLSDQWSSVTDADVSLLRKTIERMSPSKDSEGDSLLSDELFVYKEIPDIDWANMAVDANLQEVIEQRVEEIKRCITGNAPLAVIFLCGSVLEAILMSVAANAPAEFRNASTGNKNIHDFKLGELIDISSKLGLISPDAKAHAHSLRDFRNYIHPRHQITKRFTPRMPTAKLSWYVVKIAISDLSNNKKYPDSQ